MEDKKIHLLVVEDDEFLVKMYESGLTKGGFEVTTAPDGEAGASMAASVNPDLILLDLILPKMDGFACLEALKAQAETKRIPVIILSNLGQDSDIKRGLDLGAEDYLIKTDYTVKQVGDKVRKVLGVNPS